MAPCSMSSIGVNSSSQWLRPSCEGTNTMPAGPIAAMYCASWPAPERMRRWRVPYTPFDRGVVDAVERAAGAAGARHRRIRSGAGHDAQYMAAIGPAGMVFVPSHDGRSHCEEEFTPIDDIEQGATTLLLAALDLAVRA